jgi:hypothetical protein
VRGNIHGVWGSHDINGAYGGAGAEYYVLPDLGLNAEVSYNNISNMHWVDVKAYAEYMISHDYPLSVSAGYEYKGYTGYTASSGVMVRLNYRFGLTGSLVEIDRKGPVDSRTQDAYLAAY